MDLHPDFVGFPKKRFSDFWLQRPEDKRISTSGLGMDLYLPYSEGLGFFKNAEIEK